MKEDDLETRGFKRPTEKDKKENQNNPKTSPDAPLMPCVKCKKTHRKGQCKGY